MILVDLVHLLFELLIAIVWLLVESVVVVSNLLLLLVELLLGVFIAGFRLGRLSNPVRPKDGSSGEPRELSKWTAAGLLVLLAFGASLVLTPGVYRRLASREITLQAEDGLPLPLVRVLVETAKGEQAQRADLSGSVWVPRWGLKSLTVKDVRCVERSWPAADVTPILTVQRSLLARSVDRLGDRVRAWRKRE